MTAELGKTSKRKYSYVTTGSYHDYYKRNVNGELRLDLFENQWFSNKRCLDIGCNEGVLTNRIAETMQPTHILGIDIDRYVVDAANSILKRVKYDMKSSSSSSSGRGRGSNLISANATTKETSLGPLFLPRVMATKVPKNSSLPGIKEQRVNYPNNINFECTSLAKLSERLRDQTDQHFDTILCLSVAKWIHLNEGDAGLLTLFQSLFDLCRPGGRVILEFQPWKSYKNKRKVSEHIKEIFATLMIRPEQFEEILVSRFGFVVESAIGPSIADAKGYSRPILVLLKPLPLKQPSRLINDESQVPDKSVIVDKYLSTETL